MQENINSFELNELKAMGKGNPEADLDIEMEEQ